MGHGLISRDCMVIDGGGKSVVPGIVDSHAHLLLYGYTLMSVDLTGSASPNECVARIRTYLDLHKEINPKSNIWLLGHGWDQTKWPGGTFPSSKDLDIDSILVEIPISLTRIDAHALWVNAKALNLSKNIPEKVEGGEILRDADGKPSGVFLDDAMNIILSSIPPYTEEQRFEALKLATDSMLAHGVTGLHDAGVSIEDIAFFKR